VQERTGWALRAAPDLSEIEPPTQTELAALRALRDSVPTVQQPQPAAAQPSSPVTVAKGASS